MKLSIYILLSVALIGVYGKRAETPEFFIHGNIIDEENDGTLIFLAPIKIDIECFSPKCRNFVTYATGDGIGFGDVKDPGPMESTSQKLGALVSFDLTIPGTYFVKLRSFATSLEPSDQVEFKFVLRDPATNIVDPGEGVSGEAPSPEIQVISSGGQRVEKLAKDPFHDTYLPPVKLTALCENGLLIVAMNDEPYWDPISVLPADLPDRPIDALDDEEDLYEKGIRLHLIDCGDTMRFTEIGYFVLRAQVYQPGKRPSKVETFYIGVDEIDFSLDPEDTSYDDFRPNDGFSSLWFKFTFPVIEDKAIGFNDLIFQRVIQQTIKQEIEDILVDDIQVRYFNAEQVVFQIEIPNESATALYNLMRHTYAVYPFGLALYEGGLLEAEYGCDAYEELDIELLTTIEKKSGLATEIVAAIVAIACLMFMLVTCYTKHKMNKIRQANKVLAEDRKELQQKEEIVKQDQQELEKRGEELDEQEKELNDRLDELEKREQELTEKMSEIENEEQALENERKQLEEEQQKLEAEALEAENQIEQIETNELMAIDSDLAMEITKELEVVESSEKSEMENDLAEIKKEDAPSKEDYDRLMRDVKAKHAEKKRIQQGRIKKRRQELLKQMKDKDQELLAAVNEDAAKDIIKDLSQGEKELEEELKEEVSKLNTKHSGPSLEEYKSALALVESNYESKRAELVKKVEAKRAKAIEEAKKELQLDDLDSLSSVETPRISPRDTPRSQDSATDQELQAQLEKIKKDAPSQEAYESAAKELKEQSSLKKSKQRERIEARKRVLKMKKERERREVEEAEKLKEQQDLMKQAQEKAQNAKAKVASIFRKIVSNENKVVNLKEQYDSAKVQLEENVKKEKEKQREKLMARRKAIGKS